MKKKIINKSIWLIFAITMFIIGYNVYANHGGYSSDPYFAFALICSIPIISFTLKVIKYAINTGRESGEQQISITQTGSRTYYIHNNSGLGTFIGLIIGVIIGVAISPIVLLIMIVINAVQLIVMIVKYFM